MTRRNGTQVWVSHYVEATGANTDNRAEYINRPHKRTKQIYLERKHDEQHIPLCLN